MFEEILEGAWPEVSEDSSPPSQTHEGSEDTAGGKIASVFRGLPNTEEVIREKASVIARLIEMSCDDGIELALTFKENPDYPEVRVGEEEAQLIRSETAVVLLRFVDEIAARVLNPKQQAELMDELKVCVADGLDAKGAMPVWEFTVLLCKRLEEYADLVLWADPFERGGLLREYANKIGAIVNIERHALFHARLTSLLLRSLERWELKKLLEG